MTPTKQSQFEQIACYDDLMCQNIDSRRSIPGKDPVLVCPNAKCVEGSCICGANCKKDPYSNQCCSKVEEKTVTTNGQTYKTSFCIENKYPEGVVEKFSLNFEKI